MKSYAATSYKLSETKEILTIFNSFHCILRFDNYISKETRNFAYNRENAYIYMRMSDLGWNIRETIKIIVYKYYLQKVYHVYF